MAQPLRIDGDICDKFSLYTTTVAATAASFEFREYVDELGRLKAQRLIKKMRPTTDRTLKPTGTSKSTCMYLTTSTKLIPRYVKRNEGAKGRLSPP